MTPLKTLLWFTTPNKIYLGISPSPIFHRLPNIAENYEIHHIVDKSVPEFWFQPSKIVLITN